MVEKYMIITWEQFHEGYFRFRGLEQVPNVVRREFVLSRKIDDNKCEVINPKFYEEKR